jgi:hypothetical protein
LPATTHNKKDIACFIPEKDKMPEKSGDNLILHFWPTLGTFFR